LLLDAPDALRRLCSAAAPELLGYWVDVSSPGSDHRSESIVRHWRLFRNHRGIAFRGRVHEEPWPAANISPQAIGSQDCVRVRHWGYAASEALPAKAARNIHLLETSLAHDGARPLTYYYLGQELLRLGEPRRALSAFDDALRCARDQGLPELFGHAVYCGATYAALQLQDYERVLAIEASVPAEFVSAELLCDSATACRQLRRTQEAVDRFRRASLDPTAVKPALRDPACSTWLPRLRLAEIELDMGAFDRALEDATAAAGFAACPPSGMLLAAMAAARLGHVELAAANARRVLSQEAAGDLWPRARRALLEAADQAGDLPKVLEALDGPVEGLAEADALLVRAAAHGRLDDAAARREALEAGCRRFPEDVRLQAALIRALGEDALGRALQ
ncbi:MAG: hypothetical protein KGJ86_14600, partial [Chloroflexota bacterium]|nr:hypothetical protein [Chloroflexota bacterium]